LGALSHLRLWEEIAASDARGALIAEDDAIFIFHPQHVIDQISDRTDRIVFMNNRMMDYDLWQANGIRLGDASDIRKKLRGPIGTDGYFIGRSAAARAVTLVSSQGIRNVVDGFILSDLNGSLGKQRSLAATPAPVEHADENYI
jgi:GR25 family glycosyltransferase involved in LPS biosynthesis